MDLSGLNRIDSFPYRHRVSEVMRAPLCTCPRDWTILQAAKSMSEQAISALVVVDDEKPIGIITERDILRTIANGQDTSSQTVGDTMSSPVAVVRQDSFVYVALGRLERLAIRHLVAVDDTGRAVGMLTGRALLKLRAGQTLRLGDQLAEAKNATDLRAVHDQLPALAAGLLAEGVSALGVAQVISSVSADMAHHAARLAEDILGAQGKPAPAPWALLVLGSGGRGESLLAPDQDNAIIHTGTPNDDTWFSELATLISDMLDQAGIPYCKGKVMATNPEWRMDQDGWQKKINTWVKTHDPETMLSVDIFYDFIAAHGDNTLADTLRETATRASAGMRVFLSLMCLRLEEYHPPVGLFGRIKTENGRVDLKKYGLLAIVSGVRAIALQHGVQATSTQERLQALHDKNAISANAMDEITFAHEEIVGAILHQQIADIRAGRPATSYVDPKQLSPTHLHHLKEALGAVESVKLLARDSLSNMPVA